MADMFNPFVMKKWSGLFISASLPAAAIMAVIIFYQNLWYAVGAYFLVTLLSVVIGNLFLKTPFTNILESNRLMAIDVNSTGVLRVFDMGVVTKKDEISRVSGMFLRGSDGGETVHDIYDRATVLSMPDPIKDGEYFLKEGYIYMKLPSDEFNKARFGMFTRPVLLWNSQLKTFWTKDWIGKNEKDSFVEHIALFLNRLLEEESMIIRDLSRSMVELFKPKEPFAMLGQWWFWLILLLGVGAIAFLFGQPLIESLTGAGSGVSAAVGSATNAVSGVGSVGG